METLLELVIQARGGNKTALETIIRTIADQPAIDGSTILERYAQRVARGLNDWDVDDVQSKFMEIVWHAVMGTGVPSRYWDTNKGCTLSHACWQWFIQTVKTQFKKETALKRSGEHVNIDDMFEPPSKLQTVNVETIAFWQMYECEREKLTEPQRFIVDKVLEGETNLSEIARQLAKKTGENWYTEKVRLQVKQMRSLKGALEKLHPGLAKR